MPLGKVNRLDFVKMHWFYCDYHILCMTLGSLESVIDIINRYLLTFYRVRKKGYCFNHLTFPTCVHRFTRSTPRLYCYPSLTVYVAESSLNTYMIYCKISILLLMLFMSRTMGLISSVGFAWQNTPLMCCQLCLLRVSEVWLMDA